MATRETNIVISVMIENVLLVLSIPMTLVIYVEEYQVTQLAFLVVHQVHATVMTGMDEYGIVLVMATRTIEGISVDYAGTGVQVIEVPVNELVTPITEKIILNVMNV